MNAAPIAAKSFQNPDCDIAMAMPSTERASSAHRDPELPIIITEGEFKNIALWRAAWHAAGDSSDRPAYLPLGLSGVYNWRTRAPKTQDADGARVDAPQPIADLSWITWPKRRTIILFDSDIHKKIDVQVARERLTAELEQRGAEVAWFEFPKNTPPEQKGIDDFLAVNGPDAFLVLLANANPSRRRKVFTQSESSAGQKTRLFENRGDGVYCVWSDATRNPTSICPPLEIVATTSDLNEEGCGKLVRFHNRLGQEKRSVIPHVALLAEGLDALQGLISMGFHPNRDRKSLELLKDYIYESEPRVNIHCVSKIGWHGRCFVFPDESVGPDDSDEVLFHSEHASEHHYRTAGSLEEWRTNVARLCAGNSRLVFSVSVAFAAPLLELVKADGAGFHLRGGSSIGKTTALHAAGSVWGGGGQNGFLDTWQATANGLEVKAAFHNNALLCLDEFGQVSEREVGQIIYALGNGGGKGRATRHITSRPTNTFKLLYLSSGERSLADAMRLAGRSPKGGQEVRLVDIEADAAAGLGIFEQLYEFDSPAKLSIALSKSSKSYYGAPIREFLKHLALCRDAATEAVLDSQRRFLRRNLPADAVGEIHRVTTLFALVNSAGLLASSWGITGWSEADVCRSVETVFHSWLATRGDPRTGCDVAIGMQRTRAFLQTNGSSRFQTIGAPDEKIRDRAGFREKGAEGCVYFVYPETFQNEICADYDHHAIAREMVNRGYMKRNAGRHLGNKKTIPGEGRPRLIEILPAIFDDPEEQVGAEEPTQISMQNEDEEPGGHVGHVGLPR